MPSVGIQDWNFAGRKKKRGVNTQLNYEASLQIVLRQGYTENMNAHGHGW